MLIVDDLPDTVQVLCQRLKVFDYLKVLPVIADSFEARSFMMENKVDILFLDMDMPGMDGYTLIKSLPDPPVVIVCSGHNSYASESYEMMAMGYLDKMTSHEKLVKALNRAIRETADRMAMRVRKSPTLRLRCMEKRINLLIDKANIYVAEIMGKELTVYLKNEANQIEKLHSNMSLTELYSELPMQDFIRIGRSYVIHRRAIEGYTRTKISIKDLEIKISVSAIDYQELLSFLDQVE